MSKHTFDPTVYNSSDNKPISAVLEKELSRRGVLKRGGALAAFTALASLGLTGCNDDNSNDAVTPPPSSGLSLGFDSISGSKTDAVSVPAGYTAQVLAPWGTPLNDQADEWKDDGSNTSEDQLNSTGMMHDGMHFFPLEGSSAEGLLCMNHEFIDQNRLHPAGATDTNGRRPAEEVRKEINAHGVSVVHIQLVDGVWDVVKNSKYNKRYTAATEMDLTGPVASSDWLITKYTDEKNNKALARGTNNNCGNGHTPWGTYLTCEENWPGYFTRTDDKSRWTEEQLRLGISANGTRYDWDTVSAVSENETGEFVRFDVTPRAGDATQDFRNEANGHGYIVEIDPYNPQARAVKRTALGRFRHEDCSFGKLVEGQPVVFYSGHDSQFEYLYKFVSKALWSAADANPEDRIATGAKYMDKGTLYVARFNEEGAGIWLPLVPDATTKDGARLGDVPGFTTQADIILNTPGAADLMGATPMDRPEWTAVDPKTGSVYVTLTNNSSRDNQDNNSETDTNVANPREGNKYGHIIRWNEGADPSQFTWEFFLFGSFASANTLVNLSGLNETNEFGSPDGLTFDDRGLLWIQTDGGVNENTNDQMLAIIPSELNSTENMLAVNSSNQDQLKRFFVGPNDCEVTGLAFTPDNQNFFLNVQHPGNWPAAGAIDATDSSGANRARSSTVVIMKDGGGEVGL
ncbi:PhoX family protein [Endozoicomonas numazuensis]|uniref:dTDP-glucose 4,6-dehydratase n=1 Tax=Endozoicomonas numazuensis TaxID=1137799 RepID=A0A081NIC8_9GAMM|nr:PhoX family phosphatase [Endozoicomonas numazuensis]KEQ18201.1 dTDP-glucose 4,6-dehydratase [Endozoicomonas numazuensis]